MTAADSERIELPFSVRSGDDGRVYALCDRFEWAARLSRESPLSKRVSAAGLPMRPAPASVLTMLEGAATAPGERVDRSKLAWALRKADRLNACRVAGVLVDARFVTHAMGLAAMHGDAAVEVAPFVCTFGPTLPALVVRGAEWTLLVAPLLFNPRGGAEA